MSKERARSIPTKWLSLNSSEQVTCITGATDMFWQVPASNPQDGIAYTISNVRSFPPEYYRAWNNMLSHTKGKGKLVPAHAHTMKVYGGVEV